MVIKNPYISDIQKNWHSQETQSLSWAQYKINDSTIYIGNRPDIGTTENFYAQIDGWINVSDRLVKHPAKSLNQWFPWNEGGKPQLETIFGTLKTLDYWINELKLKNIYMSCDGGTHRAVSLFGFYLIAYHKNEAQHINDNYTLINRDVWSNPLEYAHSYMNNYEVLLVEQFLEKFKEGTYSHSETGISLDMFLLDKINQDYLKDYFRKRLFHQDLGTALYRLKESLSYFLTWTLIKHPYIKASIFIHKLLNTKKGQFYKKNKF